MDHTTPFHLRPYQVQAIEKLAHRALTVLPTGTGKTAIFAALGADHWNARRGAFVVLVHRDELVEQTHDQLARAGVPRELIGTVQGPLREWHKPIVVAMQQSAKREARLTDLPEEIDTLIVDEAHRYTTKQTSRLLDACEERGAKIFGFTATPQINFKSIYGPGLPFTGISFRRSIPAMIKEGYLCDVRGKILALDGLDLDTVATDNRTGDYKEGALGTALGAIKAPERVVEAWVQHAKDRKRTIVFWPTVELAEWCTRAFQQAGANVVEVYGHTPDAQRRDRIKAIRSGKANVLVNVLVGSEGFDVPEIDCVAWVRPTKSWTLYTQGVGRGFRISPGKKDCLVLDFVGSSVVHDLASLPKTLELTELKENQSAREYMEEQEEKGKREVEIDHTQAVLRDALLFTPIRWTPWHDEHIATLDRDNVVVIAPVADQDRGETLIGVFSVHLKTGTETDLGCFDYPSEAQEEAEEYIRQNGDSKLFRRAEQWRERPPSDAQLRWFRGVKPENLPKTRGEAAERITLTLYK